MNATIAQPILALPILALPWHAVQSDELPRQFLGPNGHPVPLTHDAYQFVWRSPSAAQLTRAFAQAKAQGLVAASETDLEHFVYALRPGDRLLWLASEGMAIWRLPSHLVAYLFFQPQQ